jgi:hypothetical protein
MADHDHDEDEDCGNPNCARQIALEAKAVRLHKEARELTEKRYIQPRLNVLKSVLECTTHGSGGGCDVSCQHRTPTAEEFSARAGSLCDEVHHSDEVHCRSSLEAAIARGMVDVMCTRAAYRSTLRSYQQIPRVATSFTQSLISNLPNTMAHEHRPRCDANPNPTLTLHSPT